MRDIPTSLSAWAERGRWITIAGRELFVVDVGPAQPERTLVLLHGFPTSSHDFHRVIDRLAERCRVVVHDHLGFGLSDKPSNYGYSLFEQAEQALLVWRALGIEHAHLLAHDYGTSVATELLARIQLGLAGGFTIDSLVLCNGSVHIELADLTLSQRLLEAPAPIADVFARLSSRRFFDQRIQGLLGPDSELPEPELRAMWEGIERREGRSLLPTLSHYLGERRRFWHRWIGALVECRVPTLVLWGRKDPIAVPAIADQLAGEIPGAQLHWLERLGHFPMLEDPQGWADPVVAWLKERG
ncbi:alpha/beta fold hydrolase [Nannocystaceae bacterium ST9]